MSSRSRSVVDGVRLVTRAEAALMLTAAYTGHARPMVAFLCRLVQRAPVLVTFIVSVVIEDKTRNEVDRFLTGEHADKKERFRCVMVLSEG